VTPALNTDVGSQEFKVKWNEQVDWLCASSITDKAFTFMWSMQNLWWAQVILMAWTCLWTSTTVSNLKCERNPTCCLNLQFLFVLL